MSHLKYKVATVALGLVAASVLMPGSAYAASAVKIQVCNYYADTDPDHSDINVKISGYNQNGEWTESKIAKIPKNGCKTWFGLQVDGASYDYWWRADQDVRIWNSRVVHTATEFASKVRTDIRHVPASAADGSTRRANLPNQ